MRNAAVGIALVLLVVSLAAGSVQGQAPRQVALFPSAVFRGVAAPGRYFNLVQAVVEYAPGAVSPARSEQSVRFFRVMDGELTFTVGGKTDVHARGKGFSVPPGVVVQGRNQSQTVTARVFVSSLVPASGEGAVVLANSTPSAAAPKILHSMRMPVGPLPDVIDVVQAGTRYEPGFATGLHVMNEVHAILHLEGTTTYEYIESFKEAFGPGQGGQMYVGRPGLMANRTAAPASFLITWLVTPGRPLTSAWAHGSH